MWSAPCAAHQPGFRTLGPISGYARPARAFFSALSQLGPEKIVYVLEAVFNRAIIKLRRPTLSSWVVTAYNETTTGDCPMSLRVPETSLSPDSCRRHQDSSDLVLSELNPRAVVDDIDRDSVPLNLLTFGSVREVCPKCRRAHLKLVLRQASVRVAHLFCADCASCFDAHYADGAPALTI